MNKTASIILARLDSKRLPGKSLLDIHDVPLLERCILSLRAGSSSDIILATTDREVDDPLIALAEKNGIGLFRGDAMDVAKRVLDCTEAFGLDFFARINGDSPLVRGELIEKGFELLRSAPYDFVTNLIPRRFPYGIAVEVFSTETFRKTYADFKDERHFEHISTYFYDHLSNFTPCFIDYEHGNDHDIRLVVDTPEDKIRMETLISSFEDINQMTLEEIVKKYRELKL